MKLKNAIENQLSFSVINKQKTSTKKNLFPTKNGNFIYFLWKFEFSGLINYLTCRFTEERLGLFLLTKARFVKFAISWTRNFNLRQTWTGRRSQLDLLSSSRVRRERWSSSRRSGPKWKIWARTFSTTLGSSEIRNGNNAQRSITHVQILLILNTTDNVL